jgi:hypothetical protein
LEDKLMSKKDDQKRDAERTSGLVKSVLVGISGVGAAVLGLQANCNPRKGSSSVGAIWSGI